MSDRKKRLIKISAILGILLAVLIIIYFILMAMLPREPQLPTLDYDFYEPDWKADIMEDGEYLEENRELYYTDDMGQRRPAHVSETAEEVGPVFFKMYFDALESGDHELLNSLYTREYIEKEGEFAPFTPQRVYDRDVIYISEQKTDDGVRYVKYEVTYCIMKNDGTFRRDMGSDMVRPQTITLRVDASGTVGIERVSTEYIGV